MKYKYTLWENTPLKFYRFLCALLPFSCVLGTIYFFYTLITTYVYYESPLFWLDISFRVLMLVLVYTANICLRKREWLGAKCFLLYNCVFFLFELILYYLDDAALGSYIGLALVTMVILIPEYIYFEKRRLLFTPVPAPIPADKPTDGSIMENSASDSPTKPKKTIFERYDTYITCPSCGSLVPKGTKQCECGYDLSGPAVRLGRLLRRAAPAFLCILLIIGAASVGYYAGQKSMDAELEAQYNLGFDSGFDTGSKKGYFDGHREGMKSGIEKSSKEFENYYKDGYYDAMDDIGRISNYNPTYFDGLGALHTRLSNSFFLSPNRSANEVIEILQSSESPTMPHVSGGN